MGKIVSFGLLGLGVSIGIGGLGLYVAFGPGSFGRYLGGLCLFGAAICISVSVYFLATAKKVLGPMQPWNPPPPQ